ncbi:MAG: hypothetical protein LC623_05370 [Halobacteriales archaeon]|nr:hypothetical protein [Halobacteriales archaeon]
MTKRTPLQEFADGLALILGVAEDLDGDKAERLIGGVTELCRAVAHAD